MKDMQKYDGIKPKAFWLLAQNRFNDSKEYYEEHKAQINESVIKPMRQIAAIMAPEMSKIDPMANLVPTRMVSRIRRDTRYSKDKRLYRENVWVRFMRPKAQWRTHPCIWLEISSVGYSYGIGLYDQTPALMDVFRKNILKDGKAFLEAVEHAEKVGAKLSLDPYKRLKSTEVADEIKEYYNAKSFYFIRHQKNLSKLEDDRILKELKKAFKHYAPLYAYLLKVADEFAAEQEKSLEDTKSLKEARVAYNEFEF